MTSNKPLKPYQQNFETLERAFKNDDVCLVACTDAATDAATGKLVPTICMVNVLPDSQEIELVPVAKMFTSNPYEEVTPPIPARKPEATH